MDILTTASKNYMNTFHDYIAQFLAWGQWLFFSLAMINLVYLALWSAFDRHSFSESLPQFIKKFFVMGVFYTMMTHPNWLIEILRTVQVMGKTLTHVPVDPSSIISTGIALGNKIIIPIEKSSLLSMGFGILIVAIVYMIVLFVFISIALDLALTLIMTTALISVASFFLGFAALGATSQIARQTLDVILANCIKLLGIYLVVASGSQTIKGIADAIPTNVINFDAYAWIIAASVLFWLIAKNLPNQLARIVSGAIQETRGMDAAALATSAVSYARMAQPALKMAGEVSAGIGKIAGSTAFNAGMHAYKASIDPGNSVMQSGLGSAHAMLDLGKAVGGHVADHFKNIANKLAGGPGTQQTINSVAERMFIKAKDLYSEVKAEKNFTSEKNHEEK